MLLLLVLGLVLLPARWAYWERLDAVPGFRAHGAAFRDAFYRLEDPFRRLAGGYAVPDTLPVLRLTLPDSAADRWLGQLDSLRARGVNAGGQRPWVGASLRAGTEAAEAGAALAAEVAWHGKHYRHWAGRQRSLKVRLPAGQAWWGMRRFTLLTPDNRDGAGLLLVAGLTRAAGAWHPRERVVRLEVNGADWGLYYAEEPIDADFLRRRGLAEGALLAPRAAWADDFPDHRRAPAYGQGVGFNRAAHVHALNLEPAFQEVEAPTDSLAAVARARWVVLRDLVQADAAGAPPPDSATVAAVFDVAAWGAADALRHLLADRHNLAGDNLHVAFDPATGRFRPIYRYEGGLGAAARTNGLTNAATLSYNGAPLPLWRFVNRCPALRLAKLRALHRLTARAALVERALRRAEPAAALLSRAPGAQYPIRQRCWLWATLGRDLRANRALIHRSLTQDAWLYGTARRVGDQEQLALIAETEGALQLVGVRSRPLLADIQFEGAEKAVLAPRVDTLLLPNGLSNLDVRNWLTGEKLAPGRVRVEKLK